MERINLEPRNHHNYNRSVHAAAAAATRTLARPGNVVLIPTETVYGLVCRWDDRDAVEKIYDLKMRSDTKPLALFVYSTDQLPATGAILTPDAVKLTAAFCPGPITIIIANQDGNTTGFRIPDHPIIIPMLRQTGIPLASTSANRSGRPNALSVDEALAELNGTPDLVIDDGILPADARASTVVNLACSPWKILREGPVSSTDIEQTLRSL